VRRVIFVWRFEDNEEPPSSRLLSLGIRLAINAAALWLAAQWVRGIDIEGWPSLLAAAAIFGLVNALIKPAAQLLGCPLTCLTLGLFALVINAAMLALTAWIAGLFDLEVRVDGFWAAFLGALLVGFVSALLSAFVRRPLGRAGPPLTL
jgi:putative membrane protein